MSKIAMFTALAGVAFGTLSQAAVVTFSIEPGTSSGSFNVYATDTTDATDTAALPNYGIASYTFILSNQTTVTPNASPNVTYLRTSGSGPQTRLGGFGYFPSQDNVSTVSDTQDNLTANGVPAFGIGQTGGDLNTKAPANYISLGGDRAVYQAKVLLATGTYSGTAFPTLLSGESAVFTENTGTRPLTKLATVQLVQGAVPEPASLAALGLAGIGLMVRRRKTA